MNDLLTTPLHVMHLQANAKMVPFAGYNMPVQYPAGIKAEHLHTRRHAGLFDVSHMGQASIAGPSARQDLERLLPLDLQQLPINSSNYCFLPNASGGIIDDLIITRLGDTEYFVVFNAACKDKDIAHFREHLSAATRFTPENDRALLALQGPHAAEMLGELAPGVKALRFMTGCEAKIKGMDCYVTRSGYTGEDGFEMSIAADNAVALAQMLLHDPQVAWVGLGARDSLRLEAGLCLYGHDMDDKRSPVEAGLMWAVAKSRRQGGERAGGFMGAEAIFARQQQGAVEKRVGLHVQGRAPVREGADIVDSEGTSIGQVTSGGFAPSMSAPIAMGYVRADLATPGTDLAAMVRGKPLPVTVSSMPFVPARYHRG